MDGIKKSKVSVIVPVYNDEKYIQICVDSIIFQTYGNLEIILVDDASTDHSLEICQQYAVCDNRINVLHNEQNLGLSKSREKGYRHATGEWICFVDHDDCMNPKAVESLLSHADERTDIISGKYKNVPNRIFEQYVWDEVNRADIQILEHDRAVDLLGDLGRYGVPLCLWGKIYRKTLLEKIPIIRYKKEFPQIYFEDVLLTPALVKACERMKIVDQYIYIHRLDCTSVSMNPNALEFHLQAARAADIVMAQLDEPYARNAYAKFVQNFLLVFSKNWYLVWQYYDKEAVLLHEMEELFEKYYDIYINMRAKKSIVDNICIRLFKANKVLFCMVVCRIWFDCISKIKCYL